MPKCDMYQPSLISRPHLRSAPRRVDLRSAETDGHREHLRRLNTTGHTSGKRAAFSRSASAMHGFVESKTADATTCACEG
eukprot:6173713-Pleurochrysis_carterae.AAC.2